MATVTLSPPDGQAGVTLYGKNGNLIPPQKSSQNDGGLWYDITDDPETVSALLAHGWQFFGSIKS